LNNPYGGANYEFNRIKLNDGSKVKVGSTFRLAGNVLSPVDTIFTISQPRDVNGWWTFTPNYVTSQGAAGLNWQTDNNTYNYFIANESNRPIVFYQNTAKTDTNPITILYSYGNNQIKVDYIPFELRVGATFTTADQAIWTISAIDVQRNIITVNAASYPLNRYIGETITFVNPPAAGFTRTFIGTATTMVSNSGTYVWKLNTTLNPGSYHVTATIVNTLVTGTNVSYVYPGDTVNAWNIQSIAGLNAELRLTVDTSNSGYDEVILTSILGTSRDPLHFYTFPTSVEFYSGNNLIGNSGWTRLGTSFSQIATAQITKGQVNENLHAEWPGSLNYTRTFDDQLLFQPASVYYSPIPLNQTTVTNITYTPYPITLTTSTYSNYPYRELFQAGVYYLNEGYFVENTFNWPSGKGRFKYRRGSWDWSTKTFTASTSTFTNYATTSTLIEGTFSILTVDSFSNNIINPKLNDVFYSNWIELKAEYIGSGTSVISSSTSVIRMQPPGLNSSINNQPYSIGVDKANLSTIIRRYVPFSRRNQSTGKTQEIRFNNYNRVADVITGEFQLLLEPNSFGWPNNTPISDFNVRLEFKQRNNTTGASQINTSTWAGGNVTLTSYIENYSYPYYTAVSTVTNILSDLTTIDTQVLNGGNSVLKTINFRKKFDHFDPRGTDDAYWAGNWTSNTIEINAIVTGLTGDVWISHNQIQFTAQKIEYTQGPAPGSGQFTF
jgi:hypothetical protein